MTLLVRLQEGHLAFKNVFQLSSEVLFWELGPTWSNPMKAHQTKAVCVCVCMCVVLHSITTTTHLMAIIQDDRVSRYQKK